MDNDDTQGPRQQPEDSHLVGMTASVALHEAYSVVDKGSGVGGVGGEMPYTYLQDPDAK